MRRRRRRSKENLGNGTITERVGRNIRLRTVGRNKGGGVDERREEIGTRTGTHAAEVEVGVEGDVRHLALDATDDVSGAGSEASAGREVIAISGVHRLQAPDWT